MLIIRIIGVILTGIVLFYIGMEELGIKLSCVFASLYVLTMCVKEIAQDQIENLKDKVKILESEINELKNK